MIPSALFNRKICPSGPWPKRRSARVAGGFPCFAFVSLMICSSVFGRAAVVEQDAPYRILAALRQVVGVEIEDLAARVVAEHHLVGERLDRRLPVHDAHRDGRLILEQRIALGVLDDRVRQLGVAARVVDADAAAAQ